MTEIRLHESVEVDRPSGEVWRVVADYGRDPQWRAGVLTMAPSTTGPVVVGTTTAEQLRFAGRVRRNTGEVTAVEPDARFTWRTTSGTRATGSRSVAALGAERTRVDLHLAVVLDGGERLLRPVLARLLGRTLHGDAQRLRALVERLGRETEPAGSPRRLTPDARRPA